MNKNVISTLNLLVFCSLLFGCQLTPNSADVQFNNLADEITRFNAQINPYKQSSVQANYLLYNLDADFLAKTNQQRERFLARLSEVDVTKLDEQNKINYVILRAQVQSRADSYYFNKHYMPLNSEGGFHSDLTEIIWLSDYSNEEELNLYLQRLSQIPRYFDQNMAWMRKGMEVEYTQPQVVLEGYEESIQAFIHDDVIQSPFYAPFVNNSAKLSAQEFAGMQSKAKEVLSRAVIPAYKKYLEFFTQQYRPAARSGIAIKDIPNGEAFYANRIKYFTTTDMTAEQIHELGLKEVARIRAEMEQVIEQVGFEGTFAEFIHFLRTDPQFYAKTPVQLLKEAAYISKRIDAQLPKLFHTLPQRPYGVKAVPESIAPKYTTGRYAPASNDKEAGYYWVNTYALDKRPLYVLEALTLHEAVPGHHLQISINEELTHLPDYRRTEYISAFGEGWGLYAEYLGLEVGFYQDPYSNFGRLTYEMWRAARLVVDTGMHMFGWSRQQAMDFMKNNTALSLHNVKTETDRYISWPGQALSYKIGELTIKRLRKKAEQQLGERFDLREFHYQVLRHGSIPLNVLEQQIDVYIAKTLKQTH